MKRMLSLVLLLACLAALSACGPKEMDMSRISVTREDGSVVGSPGGNFPNGHFVVQAGSETRLDVAVPVENATVSSQVFKENVSAGEPGHIVYEDESMNPEGPGLTAQVEENVLLLGAAVPGDYEVSLAIGAEGYVSHIFTFPVRVEALPMALSVGVSALGGDEVETLSNSVPVTLARGVNLLLVPEASVEGAAVTAEVGDPGIAACEATEGGAPGVFRLDALAPGETTLVFTAAKAYHETARWEIQVVVEPSPAELSLSQNSLFLTTGQSGRLGVAYQAGGTLSLAYDVTALSTEQSGGEITVTALKAGSHYLTATCAADGYADASVQVLVTVNLPPATVTAPASASLAVGESKRVAVQTAPAGAAVTAVANGPFTASYQSGELLLEGLAQGSGTVTVTAAAEGYQTATAVVSVAVTKPLPQVDTSTYAALAQQVVDYTNRARRAAGLGELAHLSAVDAPATLRAEEASRTWSHTRPDGRDGLTAFGDFGLRFRGQGENLFEGDFGPYSVDASFIVDTLMDSPTHKENILRPAYTGIGVGVYRVGTVYYVAQLFTHD